MHVNYFFDGFDDTCNYGKYSDGTFPPFLGRIVPTRSKINSSFSSSPMLSHNFSWEIRKTYIRPALQWVLRGLIRSAHLVEMKSHVSTGKLPGTRSDDRWLLLNNAYYYSNSIIPFHTLDVKELHRRKRSEIVSARNNEDEVELSDYEKLRAERVARNAERLKKLGLV